MNPADAQFNLSVMGVAGYSFGSGSKNRQEQINVVDGLTSIIGNHSYKIGVDYRRTSPTYFRKPYSSGVTFNGLSGVDGALASGTTLSAVVTSNEPVVYPVYTNFSFYAQDSFRAAERVTLVYGLRWDVNPAPGVRQGPRPYALESDMPLSGVTQSEGLYQTRWLDVAPRLGLAYQIDNTPGREMMFPNRESAHFMTWATA